MFELSNEWDRFTSSWARDAADGDYDDISRCRYVKKLVGFLNVYYKKNYIYLPISLVIIE